MTGLFGHGAQARKELLPAWVDGGGSGSGSGSTVSVNVQLVPFVVHGLGDTAPLDVVVRDASLELRTESHVANLQSKIERANLPLGVPLEIPGHLPEGYDAADVLGRIAVSDELAGVRQMWVDRLAFYVSPRLADERNYPWLPDFVSNWGIYVHAGGVETIARELYLQLGFTHQDALGYALADLLQHELTHAALDFAALRLEAAIGPLPGLGRHSCAPCLPEESLCEAQAVRTARRRVDEADPTSVRAGQLRLARALVEQSASAGLPGYRDWAAVIDEAAWITAVVEVLAHDGVPPLLARALYDETVRAKMWVPDVPLYLILDPGTAAEAERWAPGFILNEHAASLRHLRRRGGPWKDSRS